MLPIFCVVSVGRKRGKTQLIEFLLENLSAKGIRVATVKHSREAADLRGKDTWRHLEAGALEVAYVSDFQLTFFRRSNGSLEEALANFHVDPDVVIVEGFKSSPYPKILCARNPSEALEALQLIENVVGVVGEGLESRSDVDLPVDAVGKREVLELVERSVRESWVKAIPGLNCGRCEYGSCAAMADMILEGKATIRDCQMRNAISAKLAIDGVNIPLGKWPQTLLKELLKGFVRSLKLKDVDLDSAGRLVVEVNLKDENHGGAADSRGG